MLRNTFNSSKTIVRNVFSSRKYILEKEKIKMKKEKTKMETENVHKIVDAIDDLRNEVVCVCLCMAWSTVCIVYSIHNKH
jgi:hypothetical protein